MPRFEMYLMLAEKEDDKVETCEYEMICWVKDSTNMEEIKASANEKSTAFSKNRARRPEI